ncbi:gamma-glutamylcyclotransferase family protein [Pseudomonadota bacterium]
MSDNSNKRLHEVFYYGLYMDPDVLREKGVEPRNPRICKLENYELRVGNRATLLRSPGKFVYGILYSHTHSEIDSLYWGAGLNEYAAEAVMVGVGEEYVAALCCNLIVPPKPGESNPGYQQQLTMVKKNLGVPVNAG